MLNNITNFFNLIKTGMVKTQLEAKDVIPIGTKDASYGGTYKPTLIEYANFVAGLVGGSNGQVLFNDNDTIAGASNLYWDKVNNRLSGGPTPTTSNFVIQKDITNDFIMYSPATYGGIQTFPTGGGANTVVNAKLSGTHGGYGNVAMGLGTVQADGSAFFGSTAIGQASYARGIYGLALGCEAKSGSASTAPTAATAIGYNALSTRNYSVALGYNSVAAIDNAIALGNSASLLQIGGNFTPLARTHIRGLGNTSATTSLLVENSSGTEMFRVLDDGKVGIGTSSPVTNLSVNGSIWTQHSSLIGSGFNTSTWNYIKLYDNTTGDASIVLFNTGWWLRHNANASIAGKLLLGTTTDAGFMLDVNGTARVKGVGTSTSIAFSVQNISTTSWFSVRDDGRIQIGTNGAQTFIQGTTTFQAQTAADNMVVFQGALTTGTFFRTYLSGTDYPLEANANGLTIRSSGNTAQNSSSVLDIQSTTKGFLPPRMTTAQRTAIATPAVGLMVYQTDGTEGLYIYKSTGWALNS